MLLGLQIYASNFWVYLYVIVLRMDICMPSKDLEKTEQQSLKLALTLVSIYYLILTNCIMSPDLISKQGCIVRYQVDLRF